MTAKQQTDPIRQAAIDAAGPWRRVQKQVEYARGMDASRGDIQGRGELTQALVRAAAELDRLCDAALDAAADA